MSELVICRCGRQFDLRIEYTGHAYAVIFLGSGGSEVKHCPKCAASLYHELARGELHEAEQKTYITK